MFTRPIFSTTPWQQSMAITENAAEKSSVVNGLCSQFGQSTVFPKVFPHYNGLEIGVKQTDSSVFCHLPWTACYTFLKRWTFLGQLYQRPCLNKWNLTTSMNKFCDGTCRRIAETVSGHWFVVQMRTTRWRSILTPGRPWRATTPIPSCQRWSASPGHHNILLQTYMCSHYNK